MTQHQDLPPPHFISGLGEIAPAYDVLFCDVWGVVHNGVAAHLAAVEALQRFRASGGKVILISNAPVPAGAVRYRLDRLRVPRKAYDAIVTSGDVIVSLIIERGEVPLFNIGPARDRSLFRKVRQISGRTPRLVPLREAGYAVCTGLFDPEAETPADYDPLLETMLARRLDLLCANPDLVVHVGPVLMYCAGAIAERYEAAGGTVIQGGKPHAPIYERAFALAEALLGHPLLRSRVLAIGDAMQTDVKGARAQAVASLFISTGIHKAQIAELEANEAEKEAAFRRFTEGVGFVPDAVLANLVW